MRGFRTLLRDLKGKIASLTTQECFMAGDRLIREQNKFILHEIKKINQASRYQQLGSLNLSKGDQTQTLASFDYQWSDFNAGLGLTDDQTFMAQIQSQICQMTRLTPAWFSGKKVVDIGCGGGRFTYGLLSLGALVTACDQSEWALRRTSEVCHEFAERLILQQIDLLKWEEKENYDLVFCFGVVHHTGDPYLAIRNVSLKIKSGGRLFLMVYGFPETLDDFIELNAYQDLREKCVLLPFEEKKNLLIRQFGPQRAHGWFDAISPRINDLLSFSEIVELLMRLGFQDIHRTLENRNHHIIADKV